MINLRHRIRVALVTLVGGALLIAGLGTAQAAESRSVADAIADNTGSATVTGYIVGQPLSDTAITTDYTNDYAFAIADDAAESDPADMLYVQLPAEFRADWGLLSNPGLTGARVTVTGDLTDYFAHAGLKNTTDITGAAAQPQPTPTSTPSPTGSPSPTSTAPAPTDPTGYWAAANGKTGAELKAAVHDIIDDNRTLSYDEVWDALAETDADPANPDHVILLYSGRSEPASHHGGAVDEWNREHVWAKSHGDFGTAVGPGTDIHHLRPTNVQVNSTRSNKDFDIGGSPVSGAPGNYTDGDSFEPRDEVKGDVARMIMYMAVRYEDDDVVDLEMDDLVDQGKAPRMGRESVLLEWNRQDPVDDFERHRNDVIFDIQGNRNPFIDHPEWADAMFA